MTGLTCSWDPPEENVQNGEIISYSLTCSSGGQIVVDLTLKPTVFEVTVDLFSHSTTYTCSVAATNSIGTGPISDISATTEGIYTSSQLKHL